MNQADFNQLNTFGLGKWVFVPSFSHDPAGFEKNKKFLCELFKDTDVCLKDMKHTDEYLTKDDFFVFVDNDGKPQIVGNISYGCELGALRGVCDKKEQNINLKYVKVANAFLNKNIHMYGVKNWKTQINWIARLYVYDYLLNNKKYSKINIKKLIEDFGYNGYNLHNDNESNYKGIYYPAIKRKLLSHPMLKPLIAKYLGCKTNEVQLGKYVGNGKNTKYVVGDLISQYLHQDCQIQKVFGSVKIKDYIGDFDNVFGIHSTNGFSVDGTKTKVIKTSWFDNAIDFVSQK